MSVDLRDIERDLLYLKSHRETLIVHASKELKNALDRVYERASTLTATSSYGDFYDRAKRIFASKDDYPKMGSIGAVFCGYDAYKGDLPTRWLAPTVRDALIPPGNHTKRKPRETISILKRMGKLPSSTIIHHKGNANCYVFTTDSSIESLCEEELHVLVEEGVKRYKIVHYHHGVYHCFHSEFVAIKSHKFKISTPNSTSWLFLLPVALVVLLFLFLTRK